MTTFLFYTFILVLLGILMRIFWKTLLLVGAIFFIAGGILLSSAVTAVCFQFFSLMLSGLSDWGSFHTYFMYALVFFTVAIVVYGCIVYDASTLATDFAKELFKSK